MLIFHHIASNAKLWCCGDSLWASQHHNVVFQSNSKVVHPNKYLHSVLLAFGQQYTAICCISSILCCIGYANAAFHCEFQCTTRELWCIGVRSAGETCRSHKVRCLHLTVNSQWKLFTLTPKRSFGVKTV